MKAVVLCSKLLLVQSAKQILSLEQTFNYTVCVCLALTLMQVPSAKSDGVPGLFTHTANIMQQYSSHISTD